MNPSRFERFYRQRTPPWVIGRAQPDLVAVEAEGGIHGRVVLDAGCGAGDNAIFLARQGYQVTGIDLSALAIQRARHTARGAGIDVEFLALDALKLSQLGRKFGTVIDYGLFHQFEGRNIARYVRALAAVLEDEGQFIVQCFGRPLNDDPELQKAFADGWSVEWLRPSKYYLNIGKPRLGWLASIRKR